MKTDQLASWSLAIMPFPATNCAAADGDRHRDHRGHHFQADIADDPHARDADPVASRMRLLINLREM
jgi:fatty-acid desaturase